MPSIFWELDACVVTGYLFPLSQGLWLLIVVSSLEARRFLLT